ncbi:MAG TPA: hypothetical protein VFC19_19695 [Candidatus Limnocylindrales bacterium]|nr:hypothetical protein [Candidatus Limnocylindrales bacterium]
MAMSTAACALRPTEIADGGGRVARVSPTSPYVFFYVNGALRPLPRGRGLSSPDDNPSIRPPAPTAGVGDDPRSRAVWSSLESLSAGPTPAERSAGVTTALPERVALASLSVTDNTVLVGVALGSPNLPEPALMQLSCTLTSAMSGSGRVWTGTITLMRSPGDARRPVPPCDISNLQALPFSA